MLLFSVPVLPEALFQLGGQRAVELMLRSGWRADHPLDPEIAAHYRQAYARPDRVAAMLAYYRGATRPRLRRTVERLAGRPGTQRRGDNAPRGPAEHALVVWGARDPVLPLPVGEAVVRDLGSRTEMVTVPDAGHFVVEE